MTASVLARGAERISLLVSDIDGTLVTNDKQLTEGAIHAAERLAAAGVRLSLVSSRPPMGFAHLRDALRLTAPLGAFNGGVIINPDLSIIERSLVPAEDAAIALAAFAEFEIDGWLFSPERWYVTDAGGALVPKEKQTIRSEPEVVASFDALLGNIGKLVGSSNAHNRIAACEKALAERLSAKTVARRSQPYYLDVTPSGFDKGRAVHRIAEVLSVPIGEVAVIGDMANDMPMFKVAGHRIAMGNGIEDLKSMATFVTDTNERDGFAAAVDRYILPRAALARS